MGSRFDPLTYALLKKKIAAGQQQADAWLAAHLDPETGYVLDDSLTLENAAAQAKAVGDALALKAPLASAELTGTPTAPTPAAGDSSTKIATTAFIQGEIATESAALEQMILASFPTDSISNQPIASFPDGADGIPVKALTVNITPVQSGSGDPAPDNVRPISGWTGANVVVSPTLDSQDGTTYAISFPAEAGTVYDGTLNITTGLLTVNRKGVDLGSLEWAKYTSEDQYCFHSALLDMKVYANNTTPDWICSYYRIANATSLASMTSPANAYKIAPRAAQTSVMINDTSVSTGTALATKLNGQVLVYDLATPVTYQLTPVEVKTLLGQNNIFSDTGDINALTYRADPTLYIDKKLSE